MATIFVDVKSIATDIIVYLKNVLNAINRPLWMNVTTGAIRTVDTVTTVGTVSTITAGTITTVGTVTSMTQIGGIPAYDSMIIIPMRYNWGTLIRSRIT